MTDFNYKKYSLENLENWMHDAMSAAEASPQEIYDVIKSVVEDNYYTYKHQASQAYELLSLLNGGEDSFLSNDRNSNFPNENTVCDRDDPSPECKGAWSDFWEDSMPPWGHSDIEYISKYFPKEDKVTKWLLPVQQECVDGGGEYYVNFPDDLLNAANLKEGDQIEWVDNKDGSYTLRKITKPLGMDEC
jgi:hypothetical protein